MPRGHPKPKTIQHPAALEQWKQEFRNCTLKIGFHLSLSKTMLEFLCATSDDVQWDRSLYWSCQNVPDHWVGAANALKKRGLIEWKPESELEKHKQINPATRDEFYERTCVQLTPAGMAVVGLIKLAGIFVEADAAINKKARRRA